MPFHIHFLDVDDDHEAIATMDLSYVPQGSEFIVLPGLGSLLIVAVEYLGFLDPMDGFHTVNLHVARLKSDVGDPNLSPVSNFLDSRRVRITKDE